jgi:hypothetical protein
MRPTDNSRSSPIARLLQESKKKGAIRDQIVTSPQSLFCSVAPLVRPRWFFGRNSRLVRHQLGHYLHERHYAYYQRSAGLLHHTCVE